MRAWRIVPWAVLSATLPFACSSELGDGDSETHWLACKTSDDCPEARVCEARFCVPGVRDAGPTIPLDRSRPEVGPDVPVPDTGPFEPGPVTPAPLRVAPDATSPPPVFDAGQVPHPDSGEAPRVRQCPEEPPSARTGDPDPSGWIPDCEIGLLREYFRVYGSPLAMDGVVEVHPAIEQHDLLSVACHDPSHELRPVLDRYELCSRAPADLNAATTMNREDAFRVTRYLHSKLVFVTNFSSNILAFPLTSDLLELCALDSPRPGFEALCNFAQQGAETIARLDYTVLAENEGLADWLAARMHDLYGVRCADGRVPGVTCTAPGPAGGCMTAGYATCVKLCASSPECEGVEEGPECSNGVCGVWSTP